MITLTLFILFLNSVILASPQTAWLIDHHMEASTKALGNSLVSHVNGSNALIWNPARLNMNKKKDIRITHYSDETSHNYNIQTSIPIQSHIIAINIAQTTYPIDETRINHTTQYYEQTYTNTPYQITSLRTGTSLNLTKNYSIGTTMTLCKETYHNYYRNIFSVQIGIAYQYKRYQLGLLIKHINSPKLQWNTETKTTESLSKTIQFGQSLHLNNTDIISIDITLANPLSLSYGYYIQPHPLCAFRMGVNKDNPSIGIDLKLSEKSPFSIQMSYTHFNNRYLSKQIITSLKYHY